MSIKPGTFWVVRDGNAMSYEQDVDDEWYPYEFLTQGELLLVLECFPGGVHDTIFRPPFSLTTMCKVSSTWHGISYVCEESFDHNCELIGEPDEHTSRNPPEVLSPRRSKECDLHGPEDKEGTTCSSICRSQR